VRVLPEEFVKGGLVAESAVDPSAQARDAAQQEEEEEHADPNLRKSVY
jgi:hypothetical protein